MANCPVCEKDIHDPLPPLCDQCGWDVENDLTLTPSLDKIPENVQSKYEQRLAIAKRNWQELLRSKERQALAEKPGAQTPAAAKEKTEPEPTAKQQPAVTPAELEMLFKRDPFETPAEFKERLEGLGFLPAGEARLLKEKYDISSGRFPLEVTWEKWLGKLAPFNREDLFITAQRDLAQAVYSSGEKHPLEVRIQCVAGPCLATLRLNTQQVLFTVIDNVISCPLRASGSEDETVRLWDPVTGEALLLSGHTHYVSSVAFSPDGELLALGSGDKTVRLWDTTTGKEIRVLSGHTGFVFSVAFSPAQQDVADARF